MYQSQEEILTEGKSCKYALRVRDKQLQYAGFLKRLQSDASFRSFFIELLSDISFQAYQWETPSVSASSIHQPFEFVATRNSGINIPPDPGPFEQHFSADSEVAVFNNLGNDAKLIAPSPQGQKLNYSHIGVFTSEAPLEQQHKLWQTVGRVTEEQISDQPLWLNTAGGGVAWLHIRLDSRPKYYRHQPYISL